MAESWTNRMVENANQSFANPTRQDKTRQDELRQGKERLDKTRRDKTRQDKTRQDKTRQGKARQGKASHTCVPEGAFRNHTVDPLTACDDLIDVSRRQQKLTRHVIITRVQNLWDGIGPGTTSIQNSHSCRKHDSTQTVSSREGFDPQSIIDLNGLIRRNARHLLHACINVTRFHIDVLRAVANGWFVAPNIVFQDNRGECFCCMCHKDRTLWKSAIHCWGLCVRTTLWKSAVNCWDCAVSKQCRK